MVCFDETSKQLLAGPRCPIPPKPGPGERYDYECQRRGARNLFMLCEPRRAEVNRGGNKEGKITAGQLTLAFEAGVYPGSPVIHGLTCGLAAYDLPNGVVEGCDVVISGQPRPIAPLARLRQPSR